MRIFLPFFKEGVTFLLLVIYSQSAFSESDCKEILRSGESCCCKNSLCNKLNVKCEDHLVSPIKKGNCSLVPEGTLYFCPTSAPHTKPSVTQPVQTQALPSKTLEADRLFQRVKTLEGQLKKIQEEEAHFWATQKNAVLLSRDPKNPDVPVQIKKVFQDGTALLQLPDTNGTVYAQFGRLILSPDASLSTQNDFSLLSEKTSLSRQEIQNAWKSYFQTRNKQKTAANRSPATTRELSQDTEISEADCKKIAFDNTALVGPETEQENTPYCWAHAVGKLLEEQVCLTNPSLCKKNVSTTEITLYAGQTFARERHTEFSDSQLNEGDVTDLNQVMEIFRLKRDNKICLSSNNEKHFRAQFLALSKKLYDSLSSQSVCYVNEYPVSKNTSSNLSNIGATLDQIHKHLKISSQNAQITLEAAQQLVAESKGPENFFKKIALYFCKTSDRVSYGRPGVQYTSFEVPKNTSTPVENIFSFLNKNEGRKYSLGVSFCYNEFARSLGFQAKKGCGSHAVAVTALQWDHGCKVRLENFHGKRAVVPSGFYPAEKFFQTTSGIFTHRDEKVLTALKN